MSTYTEKDLLLTSPMAAAPVSQQPVRCHACKKSSCSSTSSTICQNFSSSKTSYVILHPSNLNQHLLTPIRYARYGIGGAGNIAQRRTPKIENITTSARESSSYSRITFGDENSETSDSWLRHMGIGGAGNVTSKRSISPSPGSRSSLDSKRGSMLSLSK